MSDPTGLSEPAKPLKTDIKFSESAGSLIVHRRNRGGCISIFLGVWLTGWTLGCIGIGAAIVAKPAVGLVVFGVPFYVAWLFVAGLWTWLTFGTETLVVGPSGVTCLRTAIVKLSARTIPKSECVRFRRCEGNQGNRTRQTGIELQTLGQPLQMLYGLTDEELTWLMFHLNRFIGYVPTHDDRRQVAELDELDELSSADSETDATIELTAEQTLPNPPSDNIWRMDDEGWSFTLSRRGRFNLATVAGLLFITLFWNGVVSVFVLLLMGVMPTDQPLQGKEWWGMFFFLIPFEVIGLVLLSAFLWMVLAPWRTTCWRFDRDQLTRHSSLLGFSRTRSWSLAQPVRLKLRPQPRISSNQSQPSFSSDATSTWSVVLVTGDDTDLCVIEPLTEGEGRWIGHLIRQHRPDWIRDRS